ncbi:MAG TPA: hypothetical protein PKD53_27390 [Chloroflexaceae bacterium]|nr:hypothetical protein [Chloroflexaceae bacterium]
MTTKITKDAKWWASTCPPLTTEPRQRHGRKLKWQRLSPTFVSFVAFVVKPHDFALVGRP